MSPDLAQIAFSKPVEPKMDFRVSLEIYRGPVDLLLYLVRRHELDVADICTAEIVKQFLEFLDVLRDLDVNGISEFLDVASTLIELKSRQILPGEEEVPEELADPRQELVRRLLEFKQLREAAHMLDERGRQRRDRYARQAGDAVPRPQNREQPLQELELWDLVSAFGRVLKARTAQHGPENICYDDTPIHVYMRRIKARLDLDRRVAFSDCFETGATRPTLVGMFLAVLELVRHQHARAAQTEIFGEIWLEPGDQPLTDAIIAMHRCDSLLPLAGEAA